MLRYGCLINAAQKISVQNFFEAGILSRDYQTTSTIPKQKWPEREVPALEEREFTPRSVRTGALAIKVGMTQDWDSYGALLPLTVLWIDDCTLGCGYRREKKLLSSSEDLIPRAPALSKSKLGEFRVTWDGLLPVGTPISAAHFKAGQYVDVTGITIGKGFQGTMKRHGFKGQPATHGQSRSHRLAGSTGHCQEPGKVFKGKKMAGHMGAKQRTVLNCWVFKVDPARNLIYLRGQIPGHKGNYVKVKDAHRQKQYDLPFPTFIGPHPQEVSIATPPLNPYHVYGDD